MELGGVELHVMGSASLCVHVCLCVLLSTCEVDLCRTSRSTYSVVVVRVCLVF